MSYCLILKGFQHKAKYRVTGPTLPCLEGIGICVRGPCCLLQQVVADLFDQTFGPPNGSMKDDR